MRFISIDDLGHPVHAHLRFHRNNPNCNQIRRQCDLPGLRLPRGEPNAGQNVRRCRHHFHGFLGRMYCTSPGHKPNAIAPPAERDYQSSVMSTPTDDVKTLVTDAEQFDYPIFVKAIIVGVDRRGVCRS